MSDDREPSKHEMRCRECGEIFDMRSLTEVFIHEHDGAVPTGDNVGEEVNDE